MDRLEILPFAATHLDFLKLQPAQEWLSALLGDGSGLQIEQGGDGFTGVVNTAEGWQVVGCAGVVEVWGGRWQAWALMGKTTPQLFRQAHAGVARFLAAHPARRIETAVLCDFSNGHRWAKALGFRLETERMIGYGPDGKDYAMYVRTSENVGT